MQIDINNTERVIKENISRNLDNLFKMINEKKTNITDVSLEDFLVEYNTLNSKIFIKIKDNNTINDITKKLKLAKNFI